MVLVLLSETTYPKFSEISIVFCRVTPCSIAEFVGVATRLLRTKHVLGSRFGDETLGIKHYGLVDASVDCLPPRENAIEVVQRLHMKLRRLGLS